MQSKTELGQVSEVNFDDVDQKQEVKHVDEIDHQARHDDGDGLLKSRLDAMSLWKTLVTFRRVAMYTFLAYTLNMIDGWQIAIAGTIIVQPGFVAQFGDQSSTGVLALNTTWVSAWGGIINFGQLVTSLWIAQFAARFGRKWSFYLCFATFCICLLFLTVATTPAVWLIGKFFLGVAAGIQQMTLTPYVVEIAPNRIRGGLGVFSSVWAAIGNVICLAMLKETVARWPMNYKIPLYVCWGLAGLMLVCIAMIPESPWYHARRGEKAKCQAVMRRLYGNIAAYDYEEEYAIIVRTLEHEAQLLEQEKSIGWLDTLKGGNRLRTLIVTMIFTGANLGGLSYVMVYSTYFFSIAGVDDPFQASLITACIQLLALLLLSLSIDKIGRRRPVAIAFTVVWACLWAQGGLFYSSNKATGTALLVITCIFCAAFQIILNSYWLLAAEIPQAQMRIKTGAVSMFITAIVSIGSCFAIPAGLVALNLRMSFVFGALVTPVVAFHWYFLPETKGRAPAEIDELFERKVPAWRWRTAETKVEARFQGSDGRHPCFAERLSSPSVCNQVGGVHGDLGSRRLDLAIVAVRDFPRYLLGYS